MSQTGFGIPFYTGVIARTCLSRWIRRKQVAIQNSSEIRLGQCNILP